MVEEDVDDLKTQKLEIEEMQIPGGGRFLFLLCHNPVNERYQIIEPIC